MRDETEPPSAFGYPESETWESLKAQYDNAIRQLAKDHPSDLRRWLCEIILGNATDENPLWKSRPADSDRVDTSPYKPGPKHQIAFAALYVKGQDFKLGEAEYISVADYALDELQGDLSSWPNGAAYAPLSDTSLDVMKFSFVESINESLRWVLRNVTERIYFGLPIYRRPSSESDYELVPNDDPIGVYVRGCGEREGVGYLSGMPDWTHTFFVRQSHVEAYRWIFNFEQEPTRDEVEERRRALLKHLDIPGEARALSKAEQGSKTLQAREADLIEDSVKQLAASAKENPEKIYRLFATAAADVPISALAPDLQTATHPLSLFVKRAEGDRSYYADLSELMCMKWGYLPPPTDEGAYVSLKAFALSQFHPHLTSIRESAFWDPRPHVVASNVFEFPSQAFGYALLHTCEAIHNGAPTFLKAARGTFAMEAETEPTYVYMQMRFKYQDADRECQWPTWIANRYFHREHLKVQALYFAANDGLTDEQLAARRAAFRLAIGLHESSASSPKLATTRLMRLVDEVRSTWYGQNYDSSEPDSWPKQAAIVEWLVAKRDISKRLAGAVELVACPDEIRLRR